MEVYIPYGLVKLATSSIKTILSFPIVWTLIQIRKASLPMPVPVLVKCMAGTPAGKRVGKILFIFVYLPYSCTSNMVFEALKVQRSLGKVISRASLTS